MSRRRDPLRHDAQARRLSEALARAEHLAHLRRLHSRYSRLALLQDSPEARHRLKHLLRVHLAALRRA